MLNDTQLFRLPKKPVIMPPRGAKKDNTTNTVQSSSSLTKNTSSDQAYSEMSLTEKFSGLRQEEQLDVILANLTPEELLEFAYEVFLSNDGQAKIATFHPLKHIERHIEIQSESELLTTNNIKLKIKRARELHGTVPDDIRNKLVEDILKQEQIQPHQQTYNETVLLMLRNMNISDPIEVKKALIEHSSDAIKSKRYATSMIGTALLGELNMQEMLPLDAYSRFKYFKSNEISLAELSGAKTITKAQIQARRLKPALERAFIDNNLNPLQSPATKHRTLDSDSDLNSHIGVTTLPDAEGMRAHIQTKMKEWAVVKQKIAQCPAAKMHILKVLDWNPVADRDLTRLDIQHLFVVVVLAHYDELKCDMLDYMNGIAQGRIHHNFLCSGKMTFQANLLLLKLNPILLSKLSSLVGRQLNLNEDMSDVQLKEFIMMLYDISYVKKEVLDYFDAFGKQFSHHLNHLHKDKPNEIFRDMYLLNTIQKMMCEKLAKYPSFDKKIILNPKEFFKHLSIQKLTQNIESNLPRLDDHIPDNHLDYITDNFMLAFHNTLRGTRVINGNTGSLLEAPNY